MAKGGGEDREARLRRQLRANLARRKARDRALKAQPETGDADDVACDGGTRDGSSVPSDGRCDGDTP